MERSGSQEKKKHTHTSNQTLLQSEKPVLSQMNLLWSPEKQGWGGGSQKGWRVIVVD